MRARFAFNITLVTIVAFGMTACGGQSAPPAAESTIAATVVEPTAPPTGTPVSPTAATPEPEEEATATPEPAGEATAAPMPAGDPGDAAATVVAGPLTFTIDRTRSEARFKIDEVLMGQDKTVVGVTSLVTGTLTVDPAQPGATELGPIIINARDLTTDSSRRNRALQRQVLQSARPEFEFITFTPTGIDGMPETVEIGTPFTFNVAGDLTVRDVTLPQTFAMTVTAQSASELVGNSTTMVLRSDYGIQIPNVPIVANVADEVFLEFDFTAVSGE